MNKTDHVIISWTCIGTCIMFHDTFVGGRGQGNGARGPRQIILPDQPKLGCYGPGMCVILSACLSICVCNLHVKGVSLQLRTASHRIM